MACHFPAGGELGAYSYLRCVDVRMARKKLWGCVPCQYSSPPFDPSCKVHRALRLEIEALRPDDRNCVTTTTTISSPH